jgi:hypothetical protein
MIQACRQKSVLKITLKEIVSPDQKVDLTLILTAGTPEEPFIVEQIYVKDA